MKKTIQIQLHKLLSSQLRLNMLSGSTSTVIGVGTSAVKYPLYLHFLGYEHYGAWLLLSTVLTFAQMGLLGIEPAITKLVAEEYEANNSKAVQEYFITALCMLLVTGVVLLAVAVLFKWQIVSLMGLQGSNIPLVGNLLIYMAIFSIGVLAYQVLNSVLSGVGRIDIANYSQTALQILPLFISIPLLMADKGIVSLLIANMLTYLSVFIFNIIQINRIVCINPFDITSFSWNRFQKILAFGGNVFAGSILNMTVLPITKIVITRSIGIEGVPIFELAYRIGMQVRAIFDVAFRALMPEISKLSSKGCKESIIKINKITSKAYCLLFFGAIPFYVLVFILAELVFKVWLGDNYNSSITGVFRIILLATGISISGLIRYYTFLGAGRLNVIFLAHALKAFATLGPLWLISYYNINITVHSTAWCFVTGSFFATTWLFLAKKTT